MHLTLPGAKCALRSVSATLATAGRPRGATGLRATKWCLPDKEEVPGSNPGAPTSDLQGFLPLDPSPEPRAATFLQPKCLGLNGTERDAMRIFWDVRP